MPKIGDKVKFKNNYNSNSDCVISDVAFYADHNRTYYYFDGNTRDSQSGWDLDSFTVVSNELEELRAFKAAALARFPALATPETDDDAAARIADALYNEYETAEDAIAAGIAWARANPR